jgi:sec-independent protein translocase protein TatB
VFGVSFTEFLVLGTVALLVLGPEKLPGMLRTMGQWVAKLRKLTTEVRYQSGIDEVLRAEGFEGGLNELRTIMRGGAATVATHSPVVTRPPVAEQFVADKSREYPPEGPDAYGALPEDLLPGASPEPAAPPALPEAPPEAMALPAPAGPVADPAPAAPSVSALPTAGPGVGASTNDPANVSPRETLASQSGPPEAPVEGKPPEGSPPVANPLEAPR